MPKILISYRREDSELFAGRIFDRLIGEFGKGAIYRDINSIPVGEDFRKHIIKALSECNMVPLARSR